MKNQIRKSVFETNSSSVHSLTMCSGDEWDRWVNEEIYFDKVKQRFVGENQFVLKARKCQSYEEAWGLSLSDRENEFYEDCYHRYLTYDEFNDYSYISNDTFHESYITAKGETVIAFGYYGYD